MQRERMQDQYPWTWEIPLALACGLVVAGVVACQLGRSVANWFAGAGWRWPTPPMLVSSVPGLLAGDASAGLPGVQHPASAASLWAWLTVVGTLMIASAAVAGVLAWRQWGPGRMRGMATILEAHELLGQDRLYKVRSVVRPDIYPPSPKAKR